MWLIISYLGDSFFLYKEELAGNQEPSDVITQIVNKSQRPLLSSAGTKAANAERGRPG